LARTRENIEKVEKDHAATRGALESDHRGKEEALSQRSTEQANRLQKRLEERRLALEAFLIMKKDEEGRIQATLRAKELERTELSSRLQTLPQELEQSLEAEKQALEKESEKFRSRISSLESELAQAREKSK